MYKYSDFIVVFNVELFLVNTETPLKSKDVDVLKAQLYETYNSKDQN